jgi:catechol 2,3-dioxygenase-like lactoylglutathione lyase family enzyme
MVRNFDHVTFGVTDLDAAIAFFQLLDFEIEHDVLLQGEAAAHYTEAPGIVADHVTLQLRGSDPRQEIQLLHFHEPPVEVDADEEIFARTGYNHLALCVDDIDATAQMLAANGVEIISGTVTYLDRRLGYFRGPEGILLELAQPVEESAADETTFKVDIPTG